MKGQKANGLRDKKDEKSLTAPKMRVVLFYLAWPLSPASLPKHILVLLFLLFPHKFDPLLCLFISWFSSDEAEVT